VIIDREPMRFIGGFGDGKIYSVVSTVEIFRIEEELEITSARIPTESTNEYQLNNDGTLRKAKVFDIKLEMINFHTYNYKRTAFYYNNKRYEFFVWMDMPIEEAEYEINNWLLDDIESFWP